MSREHISVGQLRFVRNWLAAVLSGRRAAASSRSDAVRDVRARAAGTPQRFDRRFDRRCAGLPGTADVTDHLSGVAEIGARSEQGVLINLYESRCGERGKRKKKKQETQRRWTCFLRQLERRKRVLFDAMTTTRVFRAHRTAIRNRTLR